MQWQPRLRYASAPPLEGHLSANCTKRCGGRTAVYTNRMDTRRPSMASATWPPASTVSFIRTRRCFIPMPSIPERLDLGGRLRAVFFLKQDVVGLVALKGRVEINQINTLVLDVTPEDFQVVAVVQRVGSHAAIYGFQVLGQGCFIIDTTTSELITRDEGAFDEGRSPIPAMRSSRRRRPTVLQDRAAESRLDLRIREEIRT